MWRTASHLHSQGRTYLLCGHATATITSQELQCVTSVDKLRRDASVEESATTGSTSSTATLNYTLSDGQKTQPTNANPTRSQKKEDKAGANRKKDKKKDVNMAKPTVPTQL